MPDPSSSPAPRSPKPTAGPVRPARRVATATPSNIVTPKEVVKPARKATPPRKATPATAKAPTEGVRLVVVPPPARAAVPSKPPVPSKHPVSAKQPAAKALRPRATVAPTATVAPPVPVPARTPLAAAHAPAPSKRTLVLMGDEVIIEVRRAQRFTLDAVAGWRAVAGTVLPELPTPPFLLDGAELAGSLGAVFDLADELLANQHKFVRELANLVPWA